MKIMLIAALLTLPSFAWSANCLDAATTQQQMNICVQSAYKKADTELNAQYQRVLAKTQGEQTRALRKAQNEWIVFRDADCNFQTLGAQGSSVFTMNHTRCLIRKTHVRTQELKKMLICPEGDTTCPLAS